MRGCKPCIVTILLGMADDIADLTPSTDNIRSLTYFLNLIIDQKLISLRKGTPYEKVRQSDTRVFVAASRRPQTISEIGRYMHITRQSVQMSVHRLMKLGVLELQPAPGNRRDKVVHLTQKGQLARASAARQIADIEREFAAIIGTAELERLRGAMAKLIGANLAGVYLTTPEA
jgi:DNA-binding MarR family transcriptional regulator